MTSAQYVWEVSRTVLCDGDGIVAVLRVYMDESGTHDDSPVITVGAAFAKPSVWKSWTKDWNRAKTPVRVHHSTDCHNRNGEYKGWLPEQRDAYVKRILPVINQHQIAGRVAGLHLRSYREKIHSRPEVAAAFGHPYIACLRWAMMDICHATQGATKRIAFIHEVNDYMDDAQDAFKYVKLHFSSLQLTLVFGDKKDYVPLQCADIFAFEGNRRLRNIRAARRKPMEIIDPDWSRVGFIEYNEGNMDDLISTMCDLYDVLIAHGVSMERSSRKPAQKTRQSRQRQASERSP